MMISALCLKLNENNNNKKNAHTHSKNNFLSEGWKLSFLIVDIAVHLKRILVKKQKQTGEKYGGRVAAK